MYKKNIIFTVFFSIFDAFDFKKALNTKENYFTLSKLDDKLENSNRFN